MNYLDVLKSEYEIIRVLSRGAHGECYLVKDGNFYLTAKVYFKNAEAECEHEREIYSTLHGSLAKEDFFQADRLKDSPILIMQTYEGATLEEYFKASPMTTAQKLSLLIRVCNSVSAMHDAGILHLDIKPSNFFISSNGNAIKPIDMGSAILMSRKYNDIDALLTSPGYRSTFGFGSSKLLSLNAMLCRDASEFDEGEAARLLNLEQSLSVEDDIHALLALIYTCLTGRTFGHWLDNAEDNFYSPLDEIKKALSAKDIPNYLVPPLADLLINTLDLSSVNELTEKLSRILEIEENRGADAFVFLRNSMDKFTPFDDLDTRLICNLKGEDFNLSDYYEKCPERLCYLVCEGGAGKTYQLNFLLKKTFESGKFIPLYIPLNDYDNSPSFILNFILNNFSGNADCPISHITRALSHASMPILLLLDGINETSYSPAKLYREIEELSKIPNLHILLTDRGDNLHLDTFYRISLTPLGNTFLEREIPEFGELQNDIQDLLRLPFYFTRYTALSHDERVRVSGASSLLDTYYESIVRRAQKSAEGEDYKHFARVIISDFLPFFAYHQSKSSHRLTFCDKDCSASWSHFKAEHDIIYEKRCINALLDFGIIRRQSEGVYAFSHQNLFSYFAAKFLCRTEEDLIKSVYDEGILKMTAEMLGRGILERISRLKGDFTGNCAEIVSKYVQMLRLSNDKISADLSDLDLSCVNLSGHSWSGSDFSGSVFDRTFLKNATLDESVKLCRTDGRVVVVSDLESRVLVFDMNLSIKAIIEPKFYWSSTLKITDTHLYLIDTYRKESYIHTLCLSTFSQSVRECEKARAAAFSDTLLDAENADCGFKAWCFKDVLVLQNLDGDYVRRVKLSEQKHLDINQVDFDGTYLQAGTRLYDTESQCLESYTQEVLPTDESFTVYDNAVFAGGVKISVSGRILPGGVSFFGDTAHILYCDDEIYLLKYNLETHEKETFCTDFEISAKNVDFSRVYAAQREDVSVVYHAHTLHFYLPDKNWNFIEFSFLPPLDMGCIRGMKFCGDRLIILHDDDMVSGVSLSISDAAPPAGSRGVSYGDHDDASHIHAFARLYSYEIEEGDIVGNAVDDDIFEVFSKEPYGKITKDFTLKVLLDTDISGCDFAMCKISPDGSPIPDEILFNT